MRFELKGCSAKAYTGTQTGNIWYARCIGYEAFGSTEQQAIKALKNIMSKEGWRVSK